MRPQEVSHVLYISFIGKLWRVKFISKWLSNGLLQVLLSFTAERLLFQIQLTIKKLSPPKQSVVDHPVFSIWQILFNSIIRLCILSFCLITSWRMHRRLEEIAAAASKEYLLEKNLSKMKVEWSDMCFEFVQYRDSVSDVSFHQVTRERVARW